MDNLILLLFTPVIGAFVLAFVRQAKPAKHLALLFALITLALTLPFLFAFVPDASIQFEQDITWLPSLGVHFHVGLDGISLPLILLTNGLIPLIILSSYKKEYAGNFYALVSAMQFGLLLVFTALDAFLFYVGWEVSLIPIYFICGLWGGADKIKITLKFFIYTFLGSLFMLIAIIYLYTQVPTANYALSSFYELHLGESTQRWLFWAFFIAFAIKMPIFPFHTWQPDTYTAAPTEGTLLLSGIMLKMGIYGLIRWLIPIVPLGVQHYGPLALTLCVIGIVYAAIIAFKQQDAKRLIAYSSISHVGLIAAGVLVWNTQSLQGAIIQMINHGISVLGLFFIIEVISRQVESRDLTMMGGLAKPAPRLASLFLIIVMGAVGLPLTNGFVGEFLLLMGVYQHALWTAVFAGLTIILGAVYLLRMYEKMMLGKVKETPVPFQDVSGTDALVLIIVVMLIIGIGVYPNPLLHLSEAAVDHLVKQVEIKF